MAKSKSAAFYCESCGQSYSKWLGKCEKCGEWNTIHESATTIASQSAPAAAIRLKDFEAEKVATKTLTNLDFLDQVLGGGLPAGSVILVAGEPGIGKSSLLFQMMLQQKDRPALYVSAEESVSQIARRFKSFGSQVPDDLFVICENRVSEILAQMNRLNPSVLVIDSIQMILSDDESLAKGGNATLREVGERLVELAKAKGIQLWIVGHVNKDGEIAGPKTLEHLVDTVLFFSLAEDSRLRILQTHKHRFGPSGELVLLEMTDKGLKQKQDADHYWIHHQQRASSGCAMASVTMGSRILTVEIQALVIQSYFPSPRRSTSGFDLNRLHLLLAVLEKRMKIPFSRMDVYLNIVGGLKVSDPSVDLAVAAALVSAANEKTISSDIVYSGELGLTGEIRPAPLLQERLRAIQKTSSKKLMAYSPEQGSEKLLNVSEVDEALKNLV